MDSPGNTGSAAEHPRITGHLAGFVEALRAKGMPVGPAETVDAARVLTHLGLEQRDVVREGLACALVRRDTHRPTFDTTFDLWFPAAADARAVTDESGAEHPRDEDGDLDVAALRDTVADLLASTSLNAKDELDETITLIVDELGRYRSMNGESFSAYQALQAMAPDQVLDKVLKGLLERIAPAGGGTPEPFALEVAKRNAAALVARFRAQVESETQRRVAQRLGVQKVTTYAVPKVAEQVDFLRASDTELRALRASVAPLARLLASRLAVRRKRMRAGSIDVRKTMRKSMTTGGVPIDLVAQRPKRTRPELVVLCDISGSVAGFSNFTLQLVHALREQFSRVRIFAFIDATDEVTAYLDAQSGLGTAISRMMAESRLITYDGHSDYGNAFATFTNEFGHALTHRASLLILGDGRTNYRDPNLAALARMVTTARQAHWLNPEPAAQWGSGDSAADLYQQIIPMHECRTAEHLAAVVARLLPV
ncbi:vWA domain-containing protein [Lolliginicoccus suaedae]|uniref:vWA domain-containing protein n=1 Tax=Lolliginicoccus suaedae TaxID=2605429 RepID=UPI0011EDB31B|nr:VWA domain-containing protein [Lolliginicoccus suaedae]